MVMTHLINLLRDNYDIIEEVEFNYITDKDCMGYKSAILENDYNIILCTANNSIWKQWDNF